MSVRENVIFGISLDPEVKSNDAMVPISGIQHGYDVEFDDSEQLIYWVENPVSVGCLQCGQPSFRTKFPQGIPAGCGMALFPEDFGLESLPLGQRFLQDPSARDSSLLSGSNGKRGRRKKTGNEVIFVFAVCLAS